MKPGQGGLLAGPGSLEVLPHQIKPHNPDEHTPPIKGGSADWEEPNP